MSGVSGISLRGAFSGAASSSGGWSVPLTSQPSTVTRLSTLRSHPRGLQEYTNPKDQLCDTAILMLGVCSENPRAGSEYCDNAERLRRENCTGGSKNNTIGTYVILGLFLGCPAVALGLCCLSMVIKECRNNWRAQPAHEVPAADTPNVIDVDEDAQAPTAQFGVADDPENNVVVVADPLQLPEGAIVPDEEKETAMPRSKTPS